MPKDVHLISLVEGDDVSIEFSDESLTISANVSEVGPGLYRLETIPLFTETASFGDVIEAERRPDGTLRFKRVVTRSGWKQYEFLLSRADAESPSPELAAILDRVIDLVGYWERVSFWDYLFIFLPPSVEWDPTEEMRIKWPIKKIIVTYLFIGFIYALVINLYGVIFRNVPSSFIWTDSIINNILNFFFGFVIPMIFWPIFLFRMLYHKIF